MIGLGASSITQPAALVARYERLRSAMLGEALPPDARGGLIVFLHQGMWRWLRMLTPKPPRWEPIPGRSATPTEFTERRAVIGLLAGMAMAINDRRPP